MLYIHLAPTYAVICYTFYITVCLALISVSAEEYVWTIKYLYIDQNDYITGLAI